MKNIFIVTGPECTGKTFLCKALAEHYDTYFIPEYARGYIEQLERPYVYDDVLHIAKMQKKLMTKMEEQKDTHPVFFDTYLIITKKWFEVVYDRYPVWLDKAILETHSYLYLLCYYDIEWQPDSVRENGGEKRIHLFDAYREELDKFHLNYYIIKGQQEERFNHACTVIDKYLKNE